MIVYGTSLSPFVRKVMVICAEKGIDYENVVVGPGQPTPDGFAAASPFRKIPAIDDGGFTLADSTAIAFYLEAKHPETRLIPDDAHARGRAVWFDEFADTIVFSAGVKIFFNRVVARLLGGVGDQAAADAAERDEMPAQLEYLEGVVPADGWLLGDFSLADIAIGSMFVNYAHAKARIEVEKHPRLVAYLARVHARPSFAKLIAAETGYLSKALAA